MIYVYSSEERISIHEIDEETREILRCIPIDMRNKDFQELVREKTLIAPPQPKFVPERQTIQEKMLSLNITKEELEDFLSIKEEWIRVSVT